MDGATYFVVHETRYGYSQPVAESRQRLHLAPRAVRFQRIHHHRLAVTPEPDVLLRETDAFGNPVTSLCIETEHTSLSVRAESWITVFSRAVPEASGTMPWDEARDRLAYHAGRRPLPEDLDATRFLFESRRARNKRDLAAWARESFPKGAPLLVGASALLARMHREFAFDPTATTVSTPVMEAFEKRRGVCQDFAHVMLSCLRSLGIAARYVSGYLLTRPPAGKPRLLGADASHAWVSIHCPGHGWVDVDPTNGTYVGTEHVTFAWGRDYEDVSPLRGVILGGGAQTIAIEVSVVPRDEYEQAYGAAPPDLDAAPPEQGAERGAGTDY